VLGAKGDGKVNGERIDPLVYLRRYLRGSTRARRGRLCALAWGHLCATF